MNSEQKEKIERYRRLLQATAPEIIAAIEQKRLGGKRVTDLIEQSVKLHQEQTVEAFWRPLYILFMIFLPIIMGLWTFVVTQVMSKVTIGEVVLLYLFMAVLLQLKSFSLKDMHVLLQADVLLGFFESTIKSLNPFLANEEEPGSLTPLAIKQRLIHVAAEQLGCEKECLTVRLDTRIKVGVLKICIAKLEKAEATFVAMWNLVVIELELADPERELPYNQFNIFQKGGAWLEKVRPAK